MGARAGADECDEVVRSVSVVWRSIIPSGDYAEYTRSSKIGEVGARGDDVLEYMHKRAHACASTLSDN